MFSTHDSPVGWKGEKMRLFLTDSRIQQGFGKSGKGTYQNTVTMRRCFAGDLHYDHKDREMVAELKTVSKSGGKSSVSSLCGLRSEQGRGCFPMQEDMGGIQTDKPLKINTFYFHEEGGVEAWLFFVLKRPVIIRSCQTIT